MTLRRLIWLGVLMTVLQSCSPGNSPEVSGLSGHIQLVDSAGNPESNVSHVTLTLASLGRATPIVTSPDVTGNWSFTNVPEGSCVLTAALSGYSNYYWFASKSGTTANSVEDGVLVRIPQYTLRLDTARFIDSTLFINASDPDWSPSNSSHLFLVYCDSLSEQTASHALVLLPAISTTTFPRFTPTVTTATLRAAGFHSGQTIYLSGSAITPYEVTAPLCYDSSRTPLFVTAGARSNLLQVTMP